MGSWQLSPLHTTVLRAGLGVPSLCEEHPDFCRGGMLMVFGKSEKTRESRLHSYVHLPILHFLQGMKSLRRVRSKV